MRDVFEVFLHDFQPEVQHELLTFLGVNDAEELNLDVIPIHTFEKEELLSDVVDGDV